MLLYWRVLPARSLGWRISGLDSSAGGLAIEERGFKWPAIVRETRKSTQERDVEWEDLGNGWSE
jgi:hypothetical protein